METEEKIRLLMSQALSDREGNGPLTDLATRLRARQPLDPINIRSFADRGFGKTLLFRILLTNGCAFSCVYCPMRAGREIPRHALSPSTLADVFLTAYGRGWVSGLFVTTGIPKSARFAMDRLIELVEILRLRRRYPGYLHAKAVAGAEAEQIDRLVDLCDRVSYNLEAACQATLDRVAPEKNFADGLALLRRVRDRSRSLGARRAKGDPRPAGRAAAAGTTAQFVVGIGPEADRDFLETSHRLWRERALHHPHFAAFRPIEDTPLEDERETPVLRENRLYQADHLLREYGFAPEDLVYGADGNLPLSRDPKLTLGARPSGAIPRRRRERRSGNVAPGAGPRSADRRPSSVTPPLGYGARPREFLEARGRRIPRPRVPRLARENAGRAGDPGIPLPSRGVPRALPGLQLFSRHVSVGVAPPSCN